MPPNAETRAAERDKVVPSIAATIVATAETPTDRHELIAADLRSLFDYAYGLGRIDGRHDAISSI